MMKAGGAVRRAGMSWVVPLLGVAAVMLLNSCAAAGTGSGAGGKVADHKPRYDYWQNGGGACCPYHAEEFESRRVANQAR